MARKNLAKKKTGLQKNTLVIDRFEAWCWECKGKLKDRQTKSCSHCSVKYTHVTTTCNPVWMESVVQAIRPDLTYEDCRDV